MKNKDKLKLSRGEMSHIEATINYLKNPSEEYKADMLHQYFTCLGRKSKLSSTMILELKRQLAFAKSEDIEMPSEETLDIFTNFMHLLSKSKIVEPGIHNHGSSDFVIFFILPC